MNKGLLHPALLALALALALSSPVLASSSRLPVHPGSSDVHMDLIRKMQSQGAWFASLAHIQAHRQEHGDNPALRLAEADALRQTGQGERARMLYSQLLKTPYQAAAHNGLGLLDANEGHLQRGIAQLRRASALAPLNVDYLNDLGYALMLAGQHAEARFPLAQAIELSPGDKRIISNVALWHLVDGKEASATAIIAQGSLPESTQLQIHALALQLKQRHQSPPLPAAGTQGVVAVTDPRDAEANAATSQAAPAGTAVLAQSADTSLVDGQAASAPSGQSMTEAMPSPVAVSATASTDTALSVAVPTSAADTATAAASASPTPTRQDPTEISGGTTAEAMPIAAVEREPVPALLPDALATDIQQIQVAQDWTEASHQLLVDAAANLAPALPEAAATSVMPPATPAVPGNDSGNTSTSGMPIRAPLLELLLTSVQQGSAS